MRRQGWIIVGLLLLGFWVVSQWLGPDRVRDAAPDPGPAIESTRAPSASDDARGTDSARNRSGNDNRPLPDVPQTSSRRDRDDRADRPLARGEPAHALLPPEALATLRRIHAGGPHPYRQDGTVFGNRERLLPQQPRGWYREFTVDTPGLSHRGARRIVTGGDPPREYWYTDDHYRSFTRFQPPAETLR